MSDAAATERRPVDPGFEPLLALLADPASVPLSSLDPPTAREVFRNLRGAEGEPATVRSVQDRTVPGPDGDVPVRVVVPDVERPTGVLVWCHGGGWVIGDLDTAAPTQASLADKASCVVVSVDYRLAPEHPAPAGLEDCWAVTAWVADHLADLGVTGGRVAVGGDSAGGNLAIVATLALRDVPAQVPVLAQWAIYPAGEPTEHYPSRELYSENYLLSERSMDWFEQCYAGDKGDWRFAPLVKDQGGMPPTLVLTAGLDPIRDQGRVYAAACAGAGVQTILLEARGTIHGFVCLRRALPSSNRDIARCVAALKLLLQGELE